MWSRLRVAGAPPLTAGWTGPSHRTYIPGKGGRASGGAEWLDDDDGGVTSGILRLSVAFHRGRRGAAVVFQVIEHTVGEEQIQSDTRSIQSYPQVVEQVKYLDATMG